MTYWRELPSLVVAREGESVTKGLLDPRFQEAIDEAAMRLGADRQRRLPRRMDPRRLDAGSEGSGPEVCDRVVADLEAQWPAERLTAYLDGL